MMILSDMINQPSGCNVVFNKTIAMEKRHSSTGAFRFPESWGVPNLILIIVRLGFSMFTSKTNIQWNNPMVIVIPNCWEYVYHSWDISPIINGLYIWVNHHISLT